MKSDLRERTKAYIIKHNLFSYGDSILVAVSGGADSICMLDVLVSLKEEFQIKISVAHLNHMLRGEEAYRDEKFVQSICKAYQVPYHVTRIDITKLSADKRCSVEEAGRIARYEFFQQLKAEYNINCIATAHNKNDNVETVLMRLMRGTSIHGLGGIPSKNDSGVIRPLLHATREEIEEYIRSHNLFYVVDRTNLENSYTRNKIRNQLLPYICEEFNENFIHTSGNNIDDFHDADVFLRNYTRNQFNELVVREEYGASIEADKMLTMDTFIAKQLIILIVKEVSGVSVTKDIAQKLYDMCSENKNDSFTVHKSLQVHVLYRTMYFVRQNHSEETSFSLEITKSYGAIRNNNKHVLYLPANLDANRLTIRKRCDGDVMFLGKCGHKKIKDILIDEKIPFFLRDTIPVVLYGNEIIWLCGIRDNPLFRAKPEEAYLKLTYKKEEKHA